MKMESMCVFDLPSHRLHCCFWNGLSTYALCSTQGSSLSLSLSWISISQWKSVDIKNDSLSHFLFFPSISFFLTYERAEKIEINMKKQTLMENLNSIRHTHTQKELSKKLIHLTNSSLKHRKWCEMGPNGNQWLIHDDNVHKTFIFRR